MAGSTYRTRRLRMLEAENTKLKKLLAEAILDNTMLKDAAKKMVTRDAKPWLTFSKIMQ
jgi:hypothetical protein